MKKHLCILMILSLLTAGCASYASQSETSPGTAAAKSAGSYAQETWAMDTSDQGTGTLQPAPASGELQSDKIIYNGSLSLRIDNLTAFSRQLDRLLEETGGFIESQSRMQEPDSALQTGTWQIRIPAESYDSFTSQLAASGTLEQEDKTATNITRNYTDVQRKIDSLKKEETRLHELLDQAQTVGDIAALEDQLRQVHDELQTWESSQADMDMDLAYSTIWITARESSASSGLAYAFDNTWQIFGQTISSIAVILIYLLPWILLAAAVVAVIWLLIRRKRKLPKLPRNEKSEN